MPLTSTHLPLRGILRLDAIACAAMGGALLLASEPVGALLRLPPALLFTAGALLIPVAVFIAVVAERPARAAVGAVILGNFAWVLASLVLLLGGHVSPSALGAAFVLVQALVVLALSALEGAALRAAWAAGAGPA